MQIAPTKGKDHLMVVRLSDGATRTSSPWPSISEGAYEDAFDGACGYRLGGAGAGQPGLSEAGGMAGHYRSRRRVRECAGAECRHAHAGADCRHLRFHGRQEEGGHLLHHPVLVLSGRDRTGSGAPHGATTATTATCSITSPASERRRAGAPPVACPLRRAGRDGLFLPSRLD